jgi:hypothetical protein
LVPPQRKFENRRMVFEIGSAGSAVWTSALGAWLITVLRSGRGVVRRLNEGFIFSFGLAPSFRGGLALRFAGNAIFCSIGDLIPWFSRRLVREVGRELLARPFCQQQLLRAYGSPSKAPAGPFALPGLSVPPSFRVRVGRYLTLATRSVD